MVKVLFGDAYDESLRAQRDRLWHREKELEADVERLEARVRELEAVVDLTRVVLDSRFHDLIPTNGEWVRLHRSDIENVLLRAKAAVDAEEEADT